MVIVIGDVEGAFNELRHTNYEVCGDEEDIWINVVNFYASRCSPVYGRSDTVQPNAIRVLWCIQVYHRRCVVSTFNQTDKYLEELIQSLKNQINNIHSLLTVQVNPNISSLIDTVAKMDYIIDTGFNLLLFPDGRQRTCLV